jgi:hypothetical protein
MFLNLTVTILYLASVLKVKAQVLRELRLEKKASFKAQNIRGSLGNISQATHDKIEFILRSKPVLMTKVSIIKFAKAFLKFLYFFLLNFITYKIKRRKGNFY